MECEISLPRSQEHTTSITLGQINQLHAPSPITNTHFNIILQFMPRSSQWAPPLGLVTKTLYALLLSTINATCPTLLFLI